MMTLFDKYAKKLEKLEADVPKIFRNVAVRGALHFRKTAIQLTDKEKLVDTGNYRRNWDAKAKKIGDDNYIECSNNVEYASHLEYGHKLRNGGRWKGRFVGERAINDTEGEVLLMLRDEIDIAMLQKKYNLSRQEAKDYLK